MHTTYDPQELVRLRALEASVRVSGLDPAAAASAISAKDAEIRRLGRKIEAMQARLEAAEGVATRSANAAPKAKAEPKPEPAPNQAAVTAAKADNAALRRKLETAIRLQREAESAAVVQRNRADAAERRLANREQRSAR